MLKGEDTDKRNVRIPWTFAFLPSASPLPEGALCPYTQLSGEAVRSALVPLLWPTGPARGSLLTPCLPGAGVLSSACLLPTPDNPGSLELIRRGIPGLTLRQLGQNNSRQGTHQHVPHSEGYNLQAHIGRNSTSRDRYNSISSDSMVFCIRPHWGSLLSHEGSSFSTFSRVLFYPILSDSDDEISTPPRCIQQMSLLEALTVAAIPVVIVVLHIPAAGIELLTNTFRLQTRIKSASYCSSTWWKILNTVQGRSKETSEPWDR